MVRPLVDSIYINAGTVQLEKTFLYSLVFIIRLDLPTCLYVSIDNFRLALISVLFFFYGIMGEHPLSSPSINISSTAIGQSQKNLLK